MDISIIDRNYTSISVLEDMKEVGDWLREQPYMVVIDEDLAKIGLITSKDYICFPDHQVIDCNFMKPIVTEDFSEEQVFALMKESDNFYLPVYDKGLLIGIVSLFSLTEYFMRRS